jgi:hypothetical protein
MFAVPYIKSLELNTELQVSQHKSTSWFQTSKIFLQILPVNNLLLIIISQRIFCLSGPSKQFSNLNKNTAQLIEKCLFTILLLNYFEAGSLREKVGLACVRVGSKGHEQHPP